MATADTILQFMGSKGPVLPVHVAKQIGSNILMASAHLSELVSRKKVRVSKIKVGGSPLYYLPGHEAQLEDFSDNLNDKEKEAYELLKQKKILRDNTLPPVQRVALRELKDFAFPLDVKFNDTKELFWKWRSASNEETTDIIRELLNPQPQVQPKPEVKREEPKVPEQKPIEKPKQVEKKIEKQKQTKLTKPEPKIEKEIAKEEKEAKPKEPELEATSPFTKELIKYFAKNSIEVIETNIIRKASEIEFTIKVPSNVGALVYFCKAKAKKKVNDGDLSSAFIQGQTKKLPVLFLTKGELTKKAQEMLEKEFRGMTLAQL